MPSEASSIPGKCYIFLLVWIFFSCPKLCFIVFSTFYKFLNPYCFVSLINVMNESFTPMFQIHMFLIDKWFKNRFTHTPKIVNFYYFHQMAVLNTSICKRAESSRGGKKGRVAGRPSKSLKVQGQKGFFIKLK